MKYIYSSKNKTRDQMPQKILKIYRNKSLKVKINDLRNNEIQ